MQYVTPIGLGQIFGNNLIGSFFRKLNNRRLNCLMKYCTCARCALNRNVVPCDTSCMWLYAMEHVEETATPRSLLDVLKAP